MNLTENERKGLSFYYLAGAGKTNIKYRAKRLSKRVFTFFMTNIYLNSICSVGSLSSILYGVL